ncbi:encapsulin-associated ferritin-like protein [Desulfovibrio sp. TomC]|uniref:encapsulin-associated ferritin-like protein n=1 Tax=Desulfovibrio sp. TomC TaxID=1562888 RepID=UPI00057598BF|nr:ferritin-like domain-containing protein [Desulfovibrio sp. TomC]KHK00716.1 Ferritin/ribonucleotide reductase-like protein [Desulfovibrio sp. TomC]
MDQYHEPVAELSPLDRDFVRALSSLKEEIEAINWYHQRVAAASDPQIKAIMAHNRDEEMEHAIMGLEWLRRTMPGWDAVMRTYLFTTGDITALEDAATSEGVTGEAPQNARSAGSGSLGIGSLKGTR